MTMTCDKHQEQQLLSDECAWCKLDAALTEVENYKEGMRVAGTHMETFRERLFSAESRLSSALDENRLMRESAELSVASMRAMHEKLITATGRLDEGSKQRVLLAEIIETQAQRIAEMERRLDSAVRLLRASDGTPGYRAEVNEFLRGVVERHRPNG